MNRPEIRLGSERFARFSRSRVGLNEVLSYSIRQTKRERPYNGRLVPRRLTDTRTERLRVDLAWGRPAEGVASKLSDSTISALAPKALAGCPSHPLQT
eukprot:1551047-Pleurochrysis_carterae.AAC.1